MMGDNPLWQRHYRTHPLVKLCDYLLLNQVSKGGVSNLLSGAVGSDQYVGEVESVTAVLRGQEETAG